MGTTAEINADNLTDTAARTANFETQSQSESHDSHPTGQIVMEVDPDHVLIDPEIKALREWTGHNDHELTIPQLANSIFEEGQKSPCLVYETADGYVMVDGERRREAIKYLRDEEGEAGVMLRILVDANIKTRDAALRAAMHSFTQKEGLKPLEFARAIKLIRKRFGYDGSGGTAGVADFLNVSPATVTQAEKLLSLPQDIIDQVQAGRMTQTAALEMGVAKAHKRADVLVTAQEIAKEEQENKQAKRKTKKGEGESQDQAAATKEATRTKPEPAPAPAPVTTKHVRSAMRKVKGSTDVVRSWRVSDASEMFERWTGPAYAPVMSKFAAGVVDRIKGKISDKELEARWDDIADALPASASEKKVAQPPMKKVTAAAGKTTTKPVAKSTVKPKGKK